MPLSMPHFHAYAVPLQKPGSVRAEATRKNLESPGGLGHVVRMPLVKDGEEMGTLEAASAGAYLTGETSAALEYLAEQLPAMLDLARSVGAETIAEAIETKELARLMEELGCTFGQGWLFGPAEPLPGLS